MDQPHKNRQSKLRLFLVLGALFSLALLLPSSHSTAQETTAESPVEALNLELGQAKAEIDEIFATSVRAPAPNILVFSDDPINSPDPDDSSSSYVGLALRELGLEYDDAASNMDLFLELLLANEYDLVIFANDVTKPAASLLTDVFNALVEYVDTGGRLIIHTWAMGEFSTHKLWEILGVTHVQTIEVPVREKALPILWWDDYPFFNEPERVPAFESLGNGWENPWPVEHQVQWASGFTPAAGYTSTPAENQAALVFGNKDMTIFRGFVDFINLEDLDGDDKPDALELWINLIYYLFDRTYPPINFNKISPANNAQDTSTSVTLVWGKSLFARNYQYCYDTNDNNICDTSWNNTTGTAANISGLTPGQTVYWQVRAQNNSGTDTYASGGAWANFTPQPLPSSFSKSSPVHNATGLIPTNTTLVWQESFNASIYNYCIETDNNGICDSGYQSVGSSTSVNLNNLAPGQTYYWQVIAFNQNGQTWANGQSTWWRFTTLPLPGAFSKTSPLNNATDVPTDVTLQWNASSQAASYQYCIDDTNNNACNSSWISTGGSTSANVGGLSTDTDYTWQVRALNASGTTLSTGGWYNFTTAVESSETFLYLPNISGAYCNGWIGPDEVEPNNSSAAANGPLCAGLSYTGSPDDALGANEEDWYYFIWNGSGNITIDLQNFLTVGQLLLYHESNFGSSLKQEADQLDKHYTINYTGTGLSGIYYVRVFAPTHSTPNPDYTLKVDFN